MILDTNTIHTHIVPKAKVIGQRENVHVIQTVTSVRQFLAAKVETTLIIYIPRLQWLLMYEAVGQDPVILYLTASCYDTSTSYRRFRVLSAWSRPLCIVSKPFVVLAIIATFS